MADRSVGIALNVAAFTAVDASWPFTPIELLAAAGAGVGAWRMAHGAWRMATIRPAAHAWIATNIGLWVHGVVDPALRDRRLGGVWPVFWETAAAPPDVCDWKHDHDGLGAIAMGTYLRRRSKLEARHLTPGRLRIVVGDTSPGAVSFA